METASVQNIIILTLIGSKVNESINEKIRSLLFYRYLPNSSDSQENSIAGECNTIEKDFI